MVSSGLTVGMLSCSKIFPVSSPTARTILVPPPSSAPILIQIRECGFAECGSRCVRCADVPLLLFESGVSTPLSNEYLTEAKSADAVLPNVAAGTSAVRTCRCCCLKVAYRRHFQTNKHALHHCTPAAGISPRSGRTSRRYSRDGQRFCAGLLPSVFPSRALLSGCRGLSGRPA